MNWSTFRLDFFADDRGGIAHAVWANPSAAVSSSLVFWGSTLLLRQTWVTVTTEGVFLLKKNLFHAWIEVFGLPIRVPVRQ